MEIVRVLQGKYGNRQGCWGDGTRKKGTISQFWIDIQEIKEFFIAGNSYRLGDGKSVRFWKDK